ncbi:MAG: hypothetical protein ACI91B_002851 [Planctomycetota bacterium]
MAHEYCSRQNDASNASIHILTEYEAGIPSSAMRLRMLQNRLAAFCGQDAADFPDTVRAASTSYGSRMSRLQITFWVLFMLAMAVYAAMVSWALPTVSAAAGGLAVFDLRPSVFDLRPTGYSLVEAKQFLAALTPEGRAFYLQVQQPLDLFYPPLITATLFLGIGLLITAPPAPLALAHLLRRAADRRVRLPGERGCRCHAELERLGADGGDRRGRQPMDTAQVGVLGAICG